MILIGIVTFTKPSNRLPGRNLSRFARLRVLLALQRLQAFHGKTLGIVTRRGETLGSPEPMILERRFATPAKGAIRLLVNVGQNDVAVPVLVADRLVRGLYPLVFHRRIFASGRTPQRGYRGQVSRHAVSHCHA